MLALTFACEESGLEDTPRKAKPGGMTVGRQLCSVGAFPASPTREDALQPNGDSRRCETRIPLIYVTELAR